MELLLLIEPLPLGFRQFCASREQARDLTFRYTKRVANDGLNSSADGALAAQEHIRAKREREIARLGCRKVHRSTVLSPARVPGSPVRPGFADDIDVVVLGVKFCAPARLDATGTKTIRQNPRKLDRASYLSPSIPLPTQVAFAIVAGAIAHDDIRRRPRAPRLRHVLHLRRFDSIVAVRTIGAKRGGR
jgi:hypothetical protein